MAEALNPNFDQQVLDPFERITEEALYDNILQHLTGSEILKLSEVSQRCDEIISDSKCCLDKIALVVNETTISDFYDFQRDYRHLRVSDTNHWPKTSQNAKMKNQKMIELSEKFSHSLVSIEVKSNLLMNDDEVLEVNLNELTELKIMLLNKFLVKFFSSTPKLKCLMIGYTTLSHADAISFVAQFRTIETLRMRFNIFDRLFAEDISSKVSFQLKTLEIQKSYNGRTTCDENLEFFLISQAESLKELEFINIAHAQTLNLILDKLKIKKLTINFVDEPINLNPTINKHVTELVLKNEQNYESLFRAAPNLRKLHIHKISKALIEYLSTQMKSVADVSFTELKDGFEESVQDFYTKYITTSEHLNKKIRFTKT